MIGRKEEVHLNIYPTKYSCKIIFFKQDKNKIEILSEVDKKISMDNRVFIEKGAREEYICLLYTSPSPRDGLLSRMPSSA